LGLFNIAETNAYKIGQTDITGSIRIAPGAPLKAPCNELINPKAASNAQASRVLPDQTSFEEIVSGAIKKNANSKKAILMTL
jgi:hypothetical protein